MTTFTFDIKKTKKNPSSNKNNASAYIDSIILSNLKDTAPYLFGEEQSKKYYTYIPKKKSKTITIEIEKITDKPKNIDFGTFIKAFNHLMKTNTYDTYDFKLDDGTPVKMFSDEIQIGYDLIPLTEGTKRIYDMLSDSRKKEIIDIYINIRK